MELQSLILGLGLTMGIFALKSGAGLGYALSEKERWSGRLLTLLFFVLGYGLLFFFCRLLIVRVDIVTHLPLVMELLKGGMLIHLLLAGLVCGWGILLLSREAKATSHGWLLLVLPCPVCAAVVLGSGVMLHHLVADGGLALLLLFICYLVLSITVALLLSTRFFSLDGHALGGVMIAVALYFILSVLIVPHWEDMERIYRLSRSKETVFTLQQGSALLLLAAGFAASVVVGYRRSAWK